MRVLLSGTSNSIIARGISTTFERHPDIANFTNMSYGNSTTVAVGDHLRHIDFSQYDFCVLDYCVNEDIMIVLGLSTPQEALNNLCAAIDAASRAGCQPIVVIFPLDGQNFPAAKLPHADLQCLADQPFRTVLKSTILPHGIPVLDGYSVLQKMVAMSDLAWTDMFMDPKHVHREVSAFIGLQTLEYMKSVVAKGRPAAFAAPLSYAPLSFVQWDRIQVQGQTRLMSRSTRLLARDMLRITPGSHITLPTSQDQSVIGVTYNKSRTIGTLDMGAVRLTEFELAKEFREDRPLTLVSLPLQTQAPSGSTFVYHFEGTTTDDQPDPSFECHGFVLRDTAVRNQLYVATCSTVAVSLADRILHSDLSQLVDTLRAHRAPGLQGELP